MILSHKTWVVIEITIYKALPSTRHTAKRFTHIFTKPYYKTNGITCKVGTGKLNDLPKATQVKFTEMKSNINLYNLCSFHCTKPSASLRGASCLWDTMATGSLQLSRGTPLNMVFPGICGVTAASHPLKSLSASHQFCVLPHKLSSHFSLVGDQLIHPTGTLVSFSK